MNKRMVSLRIAASLMLLVAVSAAACGKKNTQVPSTQPTEATDSIAQSIPSATEATEDVEVQIGVGQRGDYEEEEGTVSTQPPASGEQDATQGGSEPVAPEAPKPTVPKAPEGNKPETPEESKPVTPEETKPEAPKEPQPGEPEETLPPELLGVTFEQYLAMPIEEQEKFVESFASVKAFVAWWNAAKAYGEKPEDPTVIDGNVIDLGKLTP